MKKEYREMTEEEKKKFDKRPLTKEEEESNALTHKIGKEHCIDVLRLLARKGYYLYEKKDGEPNFQALPKLMIKIASEILARDRADGYIRELFVDENEYELRQEGYGIYQDFAKRCFPDIFFPDEWFGDYDKKTWAEAQMMVISNLLGMSFAELDNDDDPKKWTRGLSEMIKMFYTNHLDKDIEVLLDWQLNIVKNPKTISYTIIAGETNKSASYVRDHDTSTND